MVLQVPALALLMQDNLAFECLGSLGALKTCFLVELESILLQGAKEGNGLGSECSYVIRAVDDPVA